MKSVIFCLAFLVGSFAPRLMASPDYSKVGPYSIEKLKLGGPIKGQIALPKAMTGPLPIIILGHGFASYPRYHMGWAEHLASYGFAAVAISLCEAPICAPDPKKAAAQIQAALAYLQSEEAPIELRNRLDFNHIGLQGHSAGGQGFAMASEVIRPEALVLLDPVSGGSPIDRDISVPLASLPKICAPVMTLYAEGDGLSGTCNKNSLWSTVPVLPAGESFSAKVSGSTHCNGESPMRALCGPFCAVLPSKKYEATYKDYIASWFLAHMKQDPEAMARLQQENVLMDDRVRDQKFSTGSGCFSSN
ncbi:MAG: hypothetical protein EOP04_13105 [Proteobacteria bacterium]|nr:MAG: hypothetical protein EOP04_13105 [Pseudomonadota bacterium]